MKLNTLEKLRNCLRDESPVVDVDPAIAKDAVKPINRMLELSLTGTGTLTLTIRFATIRNQRLLRYGAFSSYDTWLCHYDTRASSLRERER